MSTPERTASVLACTHCGTPIEAARTPDAPPFCCTGCEVAFGIIHGAGLDRYYAERAEPAARPLPLEEGWDRVQVERDGDGMCSATLRVDGLTCTACAWVTERVLLATPGVEEALVSHATGRTRVRWNPGQADLAGIAARVAALGYRPRPVGVAAPHDRALLIRMGVAIFLAMNVMLIAASIYAGWFDGMDARDTALFRWVSLALATPSALWCASPLYARALAGLRHRVLHVDLPVSIGVLAMYAQGVWATLTAHEAWLDSLTMLVALLLAGRVAEQGGRRRAVDAAQALAGTIPQTARRVSTDATGGDSIVIVPVESLAIGDQVELGAGETVGADARVARGEGLVRLALLTGEAEPVRVQRGDRVYAGAVVESGAFTVEVTASGEHTLLAGAVRELAEAADRPLTLQLTDRIAPWFTGATLVIATLALAGWWITTDVGTAGTVAMAVLVVACPCALALAAPLASAAGLGAAARRGLLVRSGEALIRLGEIDVVALDKTGTLTCGEPRVEEADPEVLRIAAGLERNSVHPIARAIVAAAAAAGIPLPVAERVVEEPGAGVYGVVDGRRWSLGRGGPGEVLLTELDDQGRGQRGGLVGILRLRDRLRPDAARTVAQLRARGLRVVLLSGDHIDVARRMGAESGCDHVIGAASPAEKAAWIRSMGAQGHKVLFVGDGINDGPGLAAAHVGVAMGAGAPSSVLVADAVVAVEGLAPVLAGLRAGAAATRAVRGNATRSLLYNLGAVTAAVAGLVNPLVAAVLMPLSSGLVLYGASRVERMVRAEETP